MKCSALCCTLAAVFVSSCTIEVADSPPSDQEQNGVASVQSALTATCTIQIGGAGSTYTYSASLDDGESASWSTVTTSDFIRSTSGPCHFRVYNSTGLSGSNVVLGTNLSGRIRAGIDGITNKDDGGGDTWRIRSLVMARKPTDCRLHIGGNGIRMDYYGNSNPTPAMDRMSYLDGGDCGASVWNAVDYGADDSYDRFKSLHPTSTTSGDYDPGFRIRSMKIWNDGNTCASYARDQGRCLPQFTLLGNLYTSSSADRDGDGLDDNYEDTLADAFRPAHYNHSTENATRTGVFTDAAGVSVMEPISVFQVRPDGTDRVRIVYMKLWLQDTWVGGFPGCCCEGHKGDSQQNSVWLVTRPSGDANHGKFWHVAQTAGGVGSGDEFELGWVQGDDSIRGVHFVRGPGESGIPRHVAIYHSKGKHHEYADSGWSGQNDKDCSQTVPETTTAYVNGRGEEHDPAYPFRLAPVRSPSSRGDLFNYNNVGNKAHHFFNDLASFGFSGETVFAGGNFYEAEPVERGFN